MQFSTTTRYKMISRENINEMVIKFYTKILKEDNEVTKVFVDEFGDDIQNEQWQEHLEILTDFWSMIALDDPKYQGNPMKAHIGLPLSREMFSSWLQMFFEIIDSMYEPNVGQMFKARAENIAMNFMRNLNL